MPNLCPRPQLALAYRRGASSVGQREHFRATVHCYPTGRTSEAEANHSRSQRRVADISTLLLLERCSLPSSSLWYRYRGSQKVTLHKLSPKVVVETRIGEAL